MIENDDLFFGLTEADLKLMNLIDETKEKSWDLIDKMNDDISNGPQGTIGWFVGTGWENSFALNNETLFAIGGFLPFNKLNNKDYDVWNQIISGNNSDYDAFDLAMICYAGSLYTNNNNHKWFDTEAEAEAFADNHNLMFLYISTNDKLNFEVIRNIITNAINELLFSQDEAVA